VAACTAVEMLQGEVDGKENNAMDYGLRAGVHIKNGVKRQTDDLEFSKSS